MPCSGTPARFAAALACEARIGTIPSELKPFVQLRVPPEGVYLAAADAVRDLTARLEGSSADSPALKVLLDDIKNEDFTEFWSPEDKTLHEYMHQSGIAMSLVASSASTGNDTLSRVLFYLEFGRNLGDVPLLGPGKRRWLQIIGKKMQSSLHDLIVRRFDDAVLADIGAHLPDAFAAATLKTPPIAELVLKKAIAEGLTLLESAKRIRGTPEAVDYRRLLRDLRGQLKCGRSGMLEAQKMLA